MTPAIAFVAVSFGEGLSLLISDGASFASIASPSERRKWTRENTIMTDDFQGNLGAAKILKDGLGRRRLTDRLADVQEILLANPSVIGELERKIVWQLFGVISYWALNEHKRKAEKARWLMSEIESILDDFKAKADGQPIICNRHSTHSQL